MTIIQVILFTLTGILVIAGLTLLLIPFPSTVRSIERRELVNMSIWILAITSCTIAFTI